MQSYTVYYQENATTTAKKLGVVQAFTKEKALEIACLLFGYSADDMFLREEN